MKALSYLPSIAFFLKCFLNRAKYIFKAFVLYVFILCLPYALLFCLLSGILVHFSRWLYWGNVMTCTSSVKHHLQRQEKGERYIAVAEKKGDTYRIRIQVAYWPFCISDLISPFFLAWYTAFHSSIVYHDFLCVLSPRDLGSKKSLDKRSASQSFFCWNASKNFLIYVFGFLCGLKDTTSIWKMVILIARQYCVL